MPDSVRFASSRCRLEGCTSRNSANSRRYQDLSGRSNAAASICWRVHGIMESRIECVRISRIIVRYMRTGQERCRATNSKVAGGASEHHPRKNPSKCRFPSRPHFRCKGQGNPDKAHQNFLAVRTKACAGHASAVQEKHILPYPRACLPKSENVIYGTPGRLLWCHPLTS